MPNRRLSHRNVTVLPGLKLSALLLRSVRCLCLPLLILLPASYSWAQSEYRVPRNEFGQPDLQGVWNNGTITPLQRPERLGGQRSYPASEAAAIEAAARLSELEKSTPLAADRAAPEVGSRVGQEADFDFYGSYTTLTQYGGEFRTSLIVAPENGRWPFLPDYLARDYWGRQAARGLHSFDGPEGRPTGERCLDRGVLTSLARVAPYNANYQLIQTPDYVVIHAELAHDARIVKLDGNYLTGDIPQWFGDSVGYWEGDTLVVESKNFRPEQSSGFVRISEKASIVERFTRVAQDSIEYSYELTDPEIYREPVRLEMQLRRQPDDQPMYEYACHEGNYSMASILAGARREEVDAEFARLGGRPE